MRALSHLRILLIICIAMMLAFTIVGVSAAEDLTVSFMSASGTTTANTYSGQVQVSVTGTGQSSGIAYNDAFYVFTSYTTGANVTPYVMTPFHLYINGQSVTNWATAPAYSADHSYTFTINAGTTAQKLTFKIGDGYVADNSGSFTVTVTPATVPPPTVSISTSATTVTAGQAFTLTLAGASQAGLASVWWWGGSGTATIDGVETTLGAAKDFGACYGETSCTYTRTIVISTAGTYTFSANSRDLLYPLAGEAHQASEGMGIQSVTVTITAAVQKADLTVTDIVFTPANPVEGERVSIESKVKNLGNKASGVVNIKGYIDGVLEPYGSFGPLQPGATVADYSHNVQWGGVWWYNPEKVVAGTHTFRFVIDADNMEPESDETNNAFEKTLTVAQNTSCTNDCSPSGTKTCSGLGYKTCGNYDADSCMEWSNVTSCTSGQTCSGGTCIIPDNPICNCSTKPTCMNRTCSCITKVGHAYYGWCYTEPQVACTDSDNTHDDYSADSTIYVKGTTTGMGRCQVAAEKVVVDCSSPVSTRTDECVSNQPTKVYEWYCGPDKRITINTHTCPNGCENGACKATANCTDECTTLGSKTCSGTGYKTCGNYDTDSCLEWSSVTSCVSGESCTNGFCEPPPPVPNETRTCPADKPYLQCDRYLGSSPNDCLTANDWACCSNNYDCVFEGVCFKDHYYASCKPTDRTGNSNCVDTNDKSSDAEVCGDFWGYTFIQDRTGKWGDQDFDSPTCGVNCPQGSCKWMTSEVYCEPAYRWQSTSDGCDDDLTPSHEDPTGKNYCCGDDPKEYYKTGSDGTKACCAASDRMVRGGICYAPDTCTNDCSPSGTKTCSGLGYKTCGNYDADSCLDWSDVTNCGSGETCAGGTCTAAVFCGNGLCDTGENCGSCAGDCACGAGKLCCNQACSVPACAAHSDCNDGNALTIDTCSYGGSCSAICSNRPCTVRCSSDSQCNDGSSTTTDTCSNPGTCSASCTYEMCTIVCSSNAGCDDANPNTADTCSNPGTCSASCVHTQNPTYDNNGVCDVNIGENCLSAPGDCACAAGQSCKPSRTSNVNGCARIECGDGYLDRGEENCCADAGCGPGLFCDETANACVACRTDNDCGVGYCTANACVQCRSNDDCESGLCEAGACVECLVDEHCSARRIWDSLPECTSDQHSVFQRGKIIEGICNENAHKCVGQEKVIQRNVRDCSPDYCQEGKCGCADGFFACKAAKGCVAKNRLENGEACGCDEQCAGGVCQGGLCRAPSLNLSAKKPNLKMGEENEVFFSIKNPFDEEIEFTIMLSVGAGVDVSKVLACDEAIGSLCKVTRRLLPGASTSLSLGVLPQSLEQSVSVQGTVAYTYRDKTLEMSQEMSIGAEGAVEVVELPVKKTGVKRILESTLFTITVMTLLATTGIGYVYRHRLTLGVKIEDLLDSLRHDRQERRELRPSMPNREEVEAEEQLRNYILKARAKGHSDEAIRKALLKKGWDSQQVKNGLKRK